MRMAAVALVVLALGACQPSETELAGAPDEPAADPAPGAAPTPVEPPPLSAEIPAKFHGKWDASLEECGRASIMTLTVSGKELRFHESLGQIEAITPIGENAVMVSGPFEGEGESWQGEMQLELSADGNTLTATNNGQATPRVRCP